MGRSWLSVVTLVAGLLLTAGTAMAQSGQGAGALRFDPGQLQSTSQLPPGQLRTRLESLPLQARSRAMRWLRAISISNSDLDLLRVDAAGGVYFADNLRPDPRARTASATATATGTDATPTYTLDDAFLLHSKPGSANRVYIDFNGHTISGTAWNSTVPTYVALAFSADADRTTFSAAERTKIVDIWHRVAEDLAPFDIDVTTEEPASFDSHTGRILVTEDVDANGVNMPSCCSAGGVAYVNVFGGSSYHTTYSPALVYANKLGPNGETYIAEASSHEFGHNLGLSHDGTIAAGGYYGGLGSGLVSWAPIMGNGYYNNVTEWSKGEYPDANQLQDDLAIIAGKLGYKADDHGNTIGAGTALVVGAGGTVDASNPEIDPHNLLPQNKGVINSGTDVDVFSFVSGAGPLSFTISPAWNAFYRASSNRGANLDISVELRDNANALVASSEPVTDTGASIAATVGAGTYHLVITGVGNAVTPYSDYDSLGQYFINGTITTGAADLTAPTPDPMSWASVPAPTSASTIAMTATTAVDAISSVQYRFNCVSGGCVTSAWQSSPSYVASGLAASTQYGFTVQARDASGNTTAASAVANATTDTPPPPPPFVDYVATSDTPVAGSVNGGFSNTATDNGVVQSITEVDSGGKPSSRYSTLEHRWNFNVSAGVGTTVFANAYSSGSSDGDTFNFQYSLNGGTNWTNMFVVASTSAGNVQSFAIPGAPGGSILLRVVDTNRTAGAREMNTVSVDHLYIQVANPSSDPPVGNPSGMTATAVSSSQINLAWIDGVSGETNYRVERSADGVNGWTVVATLGLNSQSYSNTGLAASTTYFYRVSAFNSNGASAYASASATTQAAPPPPAINLTAVGSRVKGVSKVALSWTGATSVDIYRNGALIAAGAGGSSYTDTLGKVTGTYTHKVCVAGGTTTCSNTTTTVF